MPARRTVLGSVAALLAGCSGPGGFGRDDYTDTVPEESPRDTTTRDGGSTECGQGLVVTADLFDPAESLPVQLNDRARSLVERAVENGTAEGAHYRHTPPLEDGSYVDLDGRFYRLAVEGTGQSEVPGLTLNVEMKADRDAPADAAGLSFEDLPAVDRDALRYAISESEYEPGTEGLPRGLSVRERPVPYPNGVEESRFAAVSGPIWVRWQDRDWRVESGERLTRTRYTFSVTPSAVADDLEAFRAVIGETYLLGRAHFDADQREILRTAAKGQYEECKPPSAALSSLRETLESERQLPPPADESWYVALDDGNYQVEFIEWVA